MHHYFWLWCEIAPINRSWDCIINNGNDHINKLYGHRNKIITSIYVVHLAQLLAYKQFIVLQSTFYIDFSRLLSKNGATTSNTFQFNSICASIYSVWWFDLMVNATKKKIWLEREFSFREWTQSVSIQTTAPTINIDTLQQSNRWMEYVNSFIWNAFFFSFYRYERSSSSPLVDTQCLMSYKIMLLGIRYGSQQWGLWFWIYE